MINWASRVALVVKNPPVNAGDIRDKGSIPGSGRSPGRGHGNPLHYSCLENPMDRGVWQATVHRIRKSQTCLKWLSTSEQDPDSPAARPLHQEASTSLLSSPISEGRRNKNHNHRKLTKLITWITALSYSMKLWVMPCRATQDGWVMVESPDKI